MITRGLGSTVQGYTGHRIQDTGRHIAQDTGRYTVQGTEFKEIHEDQGRGYRKEHTVRYK